MHKIMCRHDIMPTHDLKVHTTFSGASSNTSHGVVYLIDCGFDGYISTCFSLNIWQTLHERQKNEDKQSPQPLPRMPYISRILPRA